MNEPSRAALTWWLLLVLGAAAGCKRSKAESDDSDAQAEAKKTYAMVCARCHGANGNGVGVSPSLAQPRNFRDPAFQKERSDDELARAISEGKGGMPPFKAVYTPEQIAELVRLIRDFSPEAKR